MTTFKFILVLAISFYLISCDSKGDTERKEISNNVQYKLEQITDQVIAPVVIANAKDGSDRLFIAEQSGLIRIIKKGKLLQEPFLDIKNKLAKLSNSYSEMGLLGLAFHPNYKSNGIFFIYYSAPSNEKGSDHRSIFSSFRVSADNPDVALKDEKVILTIEQPQSNHNGGSLVFGPDGYLYIATGDGGGGGDQHGKIGNAQDLSNLLGKILRIDINSGDPYTIPSDNPFKGTNERKEIFAYGLRNPWKFSFDASTGKIFAGDVGQNEYEEVNIIEKGKNYGWRYMEGLHVFDEKLSSIDKTELPIHEYGHDYGISITGGYVYRGKSLKKLIGNYIFADWNGNIRYLTPSGNKWTSNELLISGKPKLLINSFGIDEKNELYLATQINTGPHEKGSIYKLVP